MIYRSNLVCPDLSKHFKHLHSRVMGHSFGHDVPSDWADKADDDPVFGIYKRCGFWTYDEAAILYNVAKALATTTSTWLDIGTHTGWTMLHAAEAGHLVTGVDPMLRYQGFHQRFIDNAERQWSNVNAVSWFTSGEFFKLEQKIDNLGSPYAGVVIDGDHEPGKPLEDAQNAAKHLAPNGVIMFHDFVGQPVREAVLWLMDHGFKARIYFTPHVVACCWRGDFTPPDHVADPFILAQDLPARWPDFPMNRTV